jgi:hypothetical protein
MENDIEYVLGSIADLHTDLMNESDESIERFKGWMKNCNGQEDPAASHLIAHAHC